jgi:FkbM family methyltransferase
MAIAPPFPSPSRSVFKEASLLCVGFILAVAFSSWLSGKDGSASSLLSGGGLPGGPVTLPAAGAPRGGAAPRVGASAMLPAAPRGGGGGGVSRARGASAAGGGGGGGGAAPPVFKTLIRDICNGTERYPEEPPDYDIMGQPGSSIDEWDPPDCHWTDMWHPAVPMKPMNVCSHDPKIDTVISHFLHTYHFWGSPDDYLILLATGPCTPERPYMLDIGANLGVYSILGASRGCHLAAFEPLSQNILRLKASLDANGWGARALLYKHAVGKMHATVRIGFRPSNPGASALGHGGDEEEVIDQITIDNLILGKNPPRFTTPAGKLLPPFIGKHINFVKIDTEGYDTAVFDGALSTLMEGRVPHILIEFTPGDAQGTAGCDSWNFMRLIYANKYRMYEFSRAYPLKHLLETGLQKALEGKGRRVFEAWIIRCVGLPPLFPPPPPSFRKSRPARSPLYTPQHPPPPFPPRPLPDPSAMKPR